MADCFGLSLCFVSRTVSGYEQGLNLLRLNFPHACGKCFWRQEAVDCGTGVKVQRSVALLRLAQYNAHGTSSYTKVSGDKSTEKRRHEGGSTR